MMGREVIPDDGYIHIERPIYPSRGICATTASQSECMYFTQYIPPLKYIPS